MNTTNKTGDLYCVLNFSFDFLYYVEITLTLIFSLCAIVVFIFAICVHSKIQFHSIRLKCTIIQSLISGIINCLFAIVVAVYNFTLTGQSYIRLMYRLHCYLMMFGISIFFRLFFYFLCMFSVQLWFDCLFKNRAPLLQNILAFLVSISLYVLALYNGVLTFLSLWSNTDTICYCNAFYLFAQKIQWFDTGVFAAVQIITIIICIAMKLHVKHKYNMFGLTTNEHRLDVRMEEKMYLKSIDVLIKFLVVQTSVATITNSIQMCLVLFAEQRYPTLTAIYGMMANNAIRVTVYALSIPAWLIYDKSSNNILRKMKMFRNWFVSPNVSDSLVLTTLGHNHSALEHNHNVDPTKANEILNDMWAKASVRRIP